MSRKRFKEFLGALEQAPWMILFNVDKLTFVERYALLHHMLFFVCFRGHWGWTWAQAHASTYLTAPPPF